MARPNKTRLDSLIDHYIAMTAEERRIVRPVLNGIDRGLERLPNPAPAEQAAFELNPVPCHLRARRFPRPPHPLFLRERRALLRPAAAGRGDRGGVDD